MKREGAPGTSALARLRRLAGPDADAAQAQAMWLAVGRWSMGRRPDGLPDYAVSEMLAAARRNVAGRPSKFLFGYHSIRDAASSVRRQWERAGCPGMVPATRHTHRHILNLKGTRP